MFHHFFQFLRYLKPHNFVDAWKAVSIAVTGGFGILGLTTEFKHKRGLRKGKITGWGRTSLIGMVVSSLLGVAAQLIESSHNAEEASQNAKAALLLAQKSDTTLGDIQRLLSPIGSNPDIAARFLVDCDKLDSQTCKKLRQDTSPMSYIFSRQSYWNDWPLGPRAANISLRVGAFRTETDAEHFTNELTDENSFTDWIDSKTTPDLRYQIDLNALSNTWEAVQFRGQSGLYMSSSLSDGRIWLYAVSRNTRSATATGQIFSLDDLTSSTIVADTPLPTWADESWLKLIDLTFQTNDGRQRQTDVCTKVGERSGSDPFYQCKFRSASK